MVGKQKSFSEITEKLFLFYFNKNMFKNKKPSQNEKV